MSNEPMNERFVIRLPVIGAGDLIVHAPLNGVNTCGKATGMCVDVSWTKYGESGGVMDVTHLKELADGIYRWIGEYDKWKEQGEKPDLRRALQKTLYSTTSKG